MANETGATSEQIERAAEHWAISASVDWSRAPLETRAYWCASMDLLASHLVRPDERIVLADALRRILRRWFDPDDCDDDQTVDEAYDYLRAALGGWTCGYCGGIGNDPKTTECSVCGTHQRDVDAALDGSR